MLQSLVLYVCGSHVHVLFENQGNTTRNIGIRSFRSVDTGLWRSCRHVLGECQPNMVSGRNMLAPDVITLNTAGNILSMSSSVIALAEDALIFPAFGESNLPRGHQSP